LAVDEAVDLAVAGDSAVLAAGHPAAGVQAAVGNSNYVTLRAQPEES